MNFILDANIPYSAKTIFHKSDSAVHVRDVGLADASDDDIIRWAVAHDAIIVTRDLDFANIVVHPITAHVGAVILRVPPNFTSVEIKVPRGKPRGIVGTRFARADARQSRAVLNLCCHRSLGKESYTFFSLTRSAIKKVLGSFLTVVEKEELRHAVVIVEPGKYRVRHVL